ncbi:hypothetical protein N7492_000528 [Penicillium capsulatum]|uniref:chitinase n=1 Tax=Penicillium capsulatum TaxID=69766 RepID=A0A9W9IRW6_9EURO|nr:hypothetical protein N7492_000528 [Penicillium capsulatum]KAJ6130413.1 hypothetical protein N7512_003193 [Penicillium capsulatum]
MRFLRVLSTAAAMLALIPHSFAFDANSKSNVAVYYVCSSPACLVLCTNSVIQGQGANQARLANFCQDTSSDIINLGFVNFLPSLVGQWPGTNFGNQCDGNFYPNSTLLSGCHQIWEDIPVCQALGKKVLLSVGGDGAYPVPMTDELAHWFADLLWYSFGPSQPNRRYDVGLINGLVKDIFPRPFQGVSVDGFDFDIEHNGGSGYATLVNRLRSHFLEFPTRTFYISGSPQCPIPDAQLSKAIADSHFDFVWVQFYNTAGCSAAEYVHGTGHFNYGEWVTAIKQSANPSAKLYVGLPASKSAANAAYYIEPSQVKPLVEEYMGLYPETFGGIMLWEATAAENNVINGRNYMQHMKRILNGLAPPVSTSVSTVSATSTSTLKHTPKPTSSVQSSTMTSTRSSISTAASSSSWIASSTSTSSPGPLSSTSSSSASLVKSTSTTRSSTSSPVSSSYKTSSSSSISTVKSSFSSISDPSAASSSSHSSSEVIYPTTSHASSTGSAVRSSSVGKSTSLSGSPVSTSTVQVFPTPVSSTGLSTRLIFYSSSGRSKSTPMGHWQTSSLTQSSILTLSVSSNTQSFSSGSASVSVPMSSPASSVRKSSTQTRRTKTPNASGTGTFQPTSLISATPSVTPRPSSPAETITSIVVTSYTSICPTGFTTITTTYTTYFCPETSATATATPTPGITSSLINDATKATSVPEGWTTTVTVCTHCAATPTTVTLTLPNPTTVDTTAWPTTSESTIAATAVPGESTTTISRITTVTFCPRCGPTGSTLTLPVPHTSAVIVPSVRPTTTVAKSPAMTSGSPTFISKTIATGASSPHSVDQSRSQSKTSAVYYSISGKAPAASGTQTQTGPSPIYTGAASHPVLVNMFCIIFIGFMSMIILM